MLWKMSTTTDLKLLISIKNEEDEKVLRSSAGRSVGDYPSSTKEKQHSSQQHCDFNWNTNRIRSLHTVCEWIQKSGTVLFRYIVFY